jgi:hypothetical protein
MSAFENIFDVAFVHLIVQGGSNMTGTDLYVNKPHCAAAV